MQSRVRLAVAACAAGAACAVSLGALFASSAQAADFVVPFTNWQVGGTLTLAKLRQNVQFPGGSTFNGTADLTTGQLSGNVAVPPFTSTIRVLGIPTQVSEQIKQADPVTGTVTPGSGGTVSISSTTADNIYLRSVGVGLIQIPTSCHTSSPVRFALNYNGPLNLASGFSFSGSTTIPSLTGCGLLGPTLSALLSGPGNGYTLTLKPPASG
jgi:hypothetical protein